MAAAGLKTAIWNNNARSLLLLGAYPFLIAGIVWAVAFLAGWGLTATPSPRGALAFSKAFIVEYWPSVFSVVGCWFLIAYFFQTRMIRALSHAHAATREEEPDLYNMLENLCISRGMAMPRLQIIETHARNAFASGVDRNSYSITVTRGLLQSLQRDEIEAVLGHELTHILNGDVRLLIISVIFTGMIGFFAQMAWSVIRYNLYVPRRGRRSGGDVRVILALMAVAAILWIGYMATMFTRFALSRRREFMADAGSVELTKNPEAMMRALLRLAGRDRIPEATDDIALMCIENSRKFLGLFDTHPPLAGRIEAISQLTGTPVPGLRPGERAGDAERFGVPGAASYPWVTAGRKNRPHPWRNVPPSE